MSGNVGGSQAVTIVLPSIQGMFRTGVVVVQAEMGGAGVLANLEGERWAKLSVNCYVNALGGISVPWFLNSAFFEVCVC